MLEIIRTLFLFLLGLTAILCVVFPPNYFLWQLKIVISEYPHIPLLAGIIIFALPGYHRHAWIWPQLVLVIEIIVLCLYPILGAYSIASTLDQDLNNAFGPAEIKQDAFSSVRLFVPAPDAPKPRTLTYFTEADRKLQCDFYPATAKVVAPLVLVIHGGGWDSGDRMQINDFNRFLAGKGYNVVAMDYSLAPKFHNPHQVGDVKNCISYLNDHAAELKIDTSRIALLGRSAGGQIALQAGYSMEMPEIKGIVAFYTPADMVWGYSLSFDTDILKSKSLITQYMGGKLADIPEKYADATAMSHVKSDSPPTLMIHGQKDNMVAYEHNLHLIKKLGPAKVPHYLLTLPWATHGADYHLNGPSGQLSAYSVMYFLATVFKN